MQSNFKLCSVAVMSIYWQMYATILMTLYSLENHLSVNMINIERKCRFDRKKLRS